MKRCFLLITALCLLAFQAQAARGYGSTFGTGATDTITTNSNITLTSKHTLSAWINTNGLGGTSQGMIWYPSDGGALGLNGFWSLNGTTTGMVIAYKYSTSRPSWSFAVPATGWHHIAITIDGTAAANNPIAYVDGSSVAVSTGTPATGVFSPTAVHQSTGNNPGNNYTYDGKIAEFCMWQRILTANEVNGLAKGASPLSIGGSSLLLYEPLYGQLSGDQDWGPSHIALTVTGTKFQPHPPVQPFPAVHYAQ